MTIKREGTSRPCYVTREGVRSTREKVGAGGRTGRAVVADDPRAHPLQAVRAVGDVRVEHVADGAAPVHVRAGVVRLHNLQVDQLEAICRRARTGTALCSVDDSGIPSLGSKHISFNRKNMS